MSGRFHRGRHRAIATSVALCVCLACAGHASGVFTIGAAWEAYNAEPYGLVGGEGASLTPDRPDVSWQAFAPQGTLSRGQVTGLKILSIQTRSTATPIGQYSRTLADGQATVRDDGFEFHSHRPDLELAAGTMRVTLHCHGIYTAAGEMRTRRQRRFRRRPSGRPPCRWGISSRD
jgi:hypothetical protein